MKVLALRSIKEQTVGKRIGAQHGIFLGDW